MATATTEETQRLVLDDVSWRDYTRLLITLGRRHLRFTYDRGTLEIMTLSQEHEGASHFLGRLVEALTEESGLPVKGGGSTTFRRRKKERGLEPDKCYWVANEHRVRGKKKIDLRTDPPPDLALEVDISHSSLDRLAIYATLGVPEVWRFDGESLVFLALTEGERYVEVATSLTFPALGPGDLVPFLVRHDADEENAVVRDFRAWVRANRP